MDVQRLIARVPRKENGGRADVDRLEAGIGDGLPVDDERARPWAGRVRDDRASLALDHEPVESSRAACDGPAQRATGNDHERVVVVRGARELLEPAEGETGDLTRVRAGDRPCRVGGR